MTQCQSVKVGGRSNPVDVLIKSTCLEGLNILRKTTLGVEDVELSHAHWHRSLISPERIDRFIVLWTRYSGALAYLSFSMGFYIYVHTCTYIRYCWLALCVCRLLGNTVTLLCIWFQHGICQSAYESIWDYNHVMLYSLYSLVCDIRTYVIAFWESPYDRIP